MSTVIATQALLLALLAAHPPETVLRQLPLPPPSHRPALGESVRNVFGSLGARYETLSTRVSDSSHHYSKDSPWNADESLVMTVDRRVLDGRTYRFIRSIAVSPFPDEHRVWSNTDPRYVYGAHRRNKQWIRVDATMPSRNAVLKTYSASDVKLPRLTAVSFGEYEGNLDNSDSGAVLVANGVRPFLIAPRTGAVRCVVTRGGGYGREVSDATISQDGRTILVHWSRYGVDAYRASDCSFSRKLTPLTGHYDACVSERGEQVLVGESGVMIRLSDGLQLGKVVHDVTSRAHVSCRNVRRPGWAYFSTENGACDDVLRKMHKRGLIFAARLDDDASDAVELYAWDHQACPTGSTPAASYRRYPMASPSPRGERVWFKSAWGEVNGPVHSYVARAR